MPDLLTKREWLSKQGLAQPGRGRFSLAANLALEDAAKKGIKFADDAPKPPKPTKTASVKATKTTAAKPVKPASDVDPKAVRKWAASQGIAVNDRGRISAEVVDKYREAHDGQVPAKPVAHVPVSPKREKVRSETTAWTYAKRKPDDPSYVSEPLVAITSCGVCHEGIAYCNCKSGPQAPAFLGGGTALLVKPA